MLILLLSLMLLAGDDDKYIQFVKEGYLDHNSFARIGLVFKHYKYFESHSWTVSRDEKDRPRVTFHGVIEDKTATEEFHSQNQYEWRLAFKSMHLASFYGIDEDKTHLRYRIHFLFNNKGFNVEKGSLDVKTGEGAWKSKELTDRALVSVLEGIYSNENPYVSLVKGMPFK